MIEKLQVILGRVFVILNCRPDEFTFKDVYQLLFVETVSQRFPELHFELLLRLLLYLKS